MAECPECGEEEDFNSVRCDSCGYLFRHGDRADYDPADIVFTVTYECKNCTRIFKHEFGAGDEVFPKGIGKPGSSIDEVTGNPYVEIVDGDQCRPQCPTCMNDTYLTVQKRTPLRSR